MKAIFGILMLVVTLAIVAKLAKTQLSATGSVPTRIEQSAKQAAVQAGDGGPREPAVRPAPGGFAGAALGDPNAMTVPQASRNLGNQVRDRTAEALRQGEQRNQAATR